MDVTGLILVVGLLLLGVGLYLVMFRDKVVKKPASSNTTDKQDVNQAEADIYHAEPEIYSAESKIPDVEQAKFETSIEFLPDIVFPPDPVKEHVPELPRNYNETNITIMARDPETVYAYWEVSEERKAHLKETYSSKWEDSIPVLRFYDVTGVDYFNGRNAHSYMDVVINDHADNWFAHIDKPDRIVCADLGRKLNDGHFVTIARSNSTYIPRNALSNRVDPRWMLVSDDQKKLYDRIGNIDNVSSYELFERE